MNTGRKTSPTQPGIGSPITPGQSSGTSSRTNSSTRFAPPSGTEREAMPSTSFASSSVTTYPNSSGTAFSSSSQVFRPATSGQTPRSYVAKGNKMADFSMPVGEPLANAPGPPPVQVLLRHLPLSASEETIGVMLVWSKELIGVELLSPEESQDNGFCTAVLRFKTMEGAKDAKRMLDGRRFNPSMDAEMVVQIISPNGLGSAIYGGAARTGTNGYNPTTAAPGGPSGPSGRDQPQPQASFQSFDSSSSPGSFPREFVPGDTMFRGFFSPSPIGNHLDQERNHVSSKSLMTGVYNDDDDTSNILKDPRAYAENNATQGSSFGRRATAPQIPIGQMANVSLSSSSPSQMPQHTRSLRRSSPTNNGNVGNAAGMSMNSAPPPPSGLPSSSAHFQRHSYPPVNPADQNPPCNTLYVGNLPMETSEEELKALFSKQRGYKRLCLRTKANGPMCFVEFEDISYSTKALTELYGVYLHNSTKGGIRLSFSKNPLGVRSAAPNQTQSVQSHNGNGIANGLANGFSTHGPPPGLSAPPGLGNGRPNLNANANGMVGNQRQQFGYPGYPAPSNNPWNTPSHPNGAVNGGSSGANASISGRAISNGYIFNNDSNNGHGLSNGYNNSHSINASAGINGHSIINGHFINNGHGINNTYGTHNNHTISNGHGYSNDHININDNSSNNGQTSNPFAPRYTNGH